MGGCGISSGLFGVGTAALGLTGRQTVARTPQRAHVPPALLPAWLQGVHMLFEGMPDRLWKEGEKRVSKMVFIGGTSTATSFARALRSAP